MRIKIYKARFQTAGKTSEEIRSEYDDSIGPPPTTEEIELWRKTLIALDGTELFVTNSFLSSGDRYTIISWPNESDEKMMEFVYAAEQDSMFGTYQNEREQFIKDWKTEKYEPSGSLSVGASDIKIIEELRRSND
ncbi:hypothetical protein SPD48_09630 [Pseudogracilibacillus sp. SE30717A]|uniref:hypothetical protein n=1 Tax=Pseudogracilibacillus sp. SE30717A TaxID=3098293 RepID=UPI00300DC9CC